MNTNSTIKPNNYLGRENTRVLNISISIYERLMRRKETAKESIGSVVDRLIKEDDFSTDVIYDEVQHKEFININVSIAAHERLKDIKYHRKIRTINETLWRLISNAKRN